MAASMYFRVAGSRLERSMFFWAGGRVDGKATKVADAAAVPPLDEANTWVLTTCCDGPGRETGSYVGGIEVEELNLGYGE